MKLPTSRGFSLLEALIALAIGGVFLTSVLSTWFYSTKSWKQESVKSKLRYDIEKAMEKLKEDIRLSDGNGILFYPSTASNYTAVSLPTATPDSSGFLTVDENTGIVWDKTIIYHVYDSSGIKELRRTTIDSFNTSASARQSQLNQVVEDGSYDSNAATTPLIQAEDVILSISPTSTTFDGYAPSAQPSSNTSFGNKRLSSGTHEIKFRVTGKNENSSGYQMGIDRLSLTPSGGSQEVEALTVSAHSGGSPVSEDMTPYYLNGLWGGNYQMAYASGAVGNYVQFQTYYDQWLESNFASVTHSNTEVKNTNPVLSVSSRENQGLNPAWQAEAQTLIDKADNPASLGNKTIRNIILGSSITKSGQMVRFKFTASSSGDLTINSAYFGPQSSGTANFSSSPLQLYFNNGTVAEGGEDGVGAVGSVGPASITIPAGQHAWTNWFEYPISFPSPTDYLVSFSIGSSGNESYWNAPSGTNSYLENGDTATTTWDVTDSGYASDTGIHAAEELSAWINSGTATSQIYDTKLTAPAFSELSWQANGTGVYSVKVRSSSDSKMSGATDWSLLTAYTTSPANLTTLAKQRYVQFQATLQAESPYAQYPELDNIKITWPGATALVEISGVYTKRPNYGMFEVLVDGEATTSALGVELISKAMYQGKEHSFSLKASVKALNTGK